ncbi:MAG: putative ABC transporter permease [Lachnospiraceae bacterium]|nr:putative ABC transporter permease [Lachnospiraceae bacterium]
MAIAKYFVEFIVYSFLGWIWECTYCSIKTGHWDNRGFLHGPVVPIYGTGAVLCSLGFGSLHLFGSSPMPLWQVFVICSVGSAILEYSTSYFLEKRFHAVWWDYSDVPLNLHGRICLPATLTFGLVGVLLVRFVIPFSETVKIQIPGLLAEVLALFFMGILSSDLVLTVQSLTDLAAKLDAAEEEFNATMEARYEKVGETKQMLSTSVQNAQLRAMNAAKALSARQSYHLRTIRHFTSDKTTRIGRWLADGLKKNLPGRKENKTES